MLIKTFTVSVEPDIIDCLDEIKKIISSKKMFGTLREQDDVIDIKVSLCKVVFVVKNIEHIKGNIYSVDVTILDTNKGEIVQGIMNLGVEYKLVPIYLYNGDDAYTFVRFDIEEKK